jgi:spore maturation protein CgeB
VKVLNVSDATASYPAYTASFRRRFPDVESGAYDVQHKWLDYDHFVWAMPFNQSLQRLGYSVLNVDRGIPSIQRAWARERMPNRASLTVDDIVVEQAKSFAPDVVFYDSADRDLLRRLRAEVPTIRRVIGWVGSTIPMGNAWDSIDLLITCAPESLPLVRSAGKRCEFLMHSFNPAICERLANDAEAIDISFIGSVVRRNRFHLNREKLLLELPEVVPVTVYSPSAHIGFGDYAKAAAAGVAHVGIETLKRAGIFEIAKRMPTVERAERVASPFRRPVGQKLKKRLRPGVYGLEYYSVLAHSKVNLNVHADTSPEFASNQRLFEATGVGTCLLTDWRANLSDLFEPDREVVTYKTTEEAAEKARWLLDHPEERAHIAAAGQRRTLKHHTFADRAEVLDQIIRGAVA